MQSRLNVVVQGTKLIYDYIKENLAVPNTIFYSKIQDSKFMKMAENAHVIVTMSWGKSMFGGKGEIKIPNTKRLRLIHTPGAGTDGLNLNFIPHNCKICNVYEHERPIAEYCLANMLNWEIKLIEKINRFKKLDWSDSLFSSGTPHSELSSRCVGILGYGRIGKEIAKILKPLNTQVIAFTRVENKKSKYINQSLLFTSLKKYAKKLDYLIICCPLNDTTKNLINFKIFNSMKNSAVIINIARGDIVNERDFYLALKNKVIGGAIVDTWYRYPLNKDIKNIKPSKYNFHKLNNVIMTPHISAWSGAMIIRRSEFIKKNIENLFNGKKLSNLVYTSKTS